MPFLSSIPLLGSSDTSSQAFSLLKLFDDDQEPKDEAYWNRIKSTFNLSPDIVDFNSAGLSPLTKEVLSGYLKGIREFYDLPSKGVSRSRNDQIFMMESLAGVVNCKTAELVALRNATEALATAIFGIPLNEGDEVIVSKYDYPHVYYAWKQRVLRDGIVLKYIELEPCPRSPKKIIQSYLEQLSSKTRAIFVTDLINYTGCQVPTKEIMAALPDHVRYRIVDAAQSFANSRNDFKDFGATHVGTSLHKWLGAPTAGGLLYIAEEYISETWPMFAAPHSQINKINKFSHIGTMNSPIISAVILALAYYNKLGATNKHDRLIDLSNYFVEQVKTVKDVTILSPRHSKLKSNMVVFKMKSRTTKWLHHKLWHTGAIHATTSNWEDIDGIRVSFNLNINKADVDRLVACLHQLQK